MGPRSRTIAAWAAVSVASFLVLAWALGGDAPRPREVLPPSTLPAPPEPEPSAERHPLAGASSSETAPARGAHREDAVRGEENDAEREPKGKQKGKEKRGGERGKGRAGG